MNGWYIECAEECEEKQLKETMSITELRAKIMREMDNYIRENVDDEDVFIYWLQEGVPDEADDEMLLELAEIESCWISIINAFSNICKQVGIIEE